MHASTGEFPIIFVDLRVPLAILHRHIHFASTLYFIHPNMLCAHFHRAHLTHGQWTVSVCVWAFAQKLSIRDTRVHYVGAFLVVGSGCVFVQMKHIIYSVKCCYLKWNVFLHIFLCSGIFPQLWHRAVRVCLCSIAWFPAAAMRFARVLPNLSPVNLYFQLEFVISFCSSVCYQPGPVADKIK